MPSPGLFLSCEHASNEIPAQVAGYFRPDAAKSMLLTHRGYDIGAFDVFRELSQELGPNFALAGTFSRLAIDLNRNSDRNGRFSEWTETAGAAEKAFLERYFAEFRKKFLDALNDYFIHNSGPAVHISVHSFTPELNGSVRNADIGLLYDPARKPEKILAKRWKEGLAEIRPDLRVRFNYPYLGKTDGHATSLRKLFSAERYAGFELEMNQAFLARESAKDVAKLLAESLLPIFRST